MRVSRRQFLKFGGVAGGFAVAQFAGLPGWAQALRSAPCLSNSGTTFAPFAQHFVDLIEPGGDEFVTEQYAFQLEALLNAWSLSLSENADRQTLKLALELQASSLDTVSVAARRTAAPNPLRTQKLNFSSSETTTGRDFQQSLHTYLGSLGKVEVAETRISSIEVVSEAPLQLHTKVQYLLAGTPQEDIREQRTGEWELTWHQTSDGDWTISGWTALHEDRSALTGPAFVDITTEVLGGNPSAAAQLANGIDHWRTVLDGAFAVDIYGNNGISVGDYDGDGLDDIYVCQPAGLPNRLYRNRGDGTLDDVTDKAGVGVIDATSSAIFADLRNTGLQDLVVVRANGPLLFLNNGDGTFHLKPGAFPFANPPQGSFTAVAVADYNLDGLLDIYFCLYSYYQGLSDYQFPTPFYDAQNGPPNFLFRNRGEGTFEDVTKVTGMDESNNRYTVACAWNDYNQDGYPDLYVVNDFGRKVLYRNNGNGTFTDVSAELGVEDQGEGMSSTWFDYDNDGRDDLYTVNMWEAAGKRVTMQDQFMPGVPEDVRSAYKRDAAGNSLLHQEKATGVFKDVTEGSSTRVGGWNWSSGAWDVDHDGFQDLYVANGFITGPGQVDLSSFYWRQVVGRSMRGGDRSKGYEEAWSMINEAIRSDYTWSGRQRNNFYLNNGDGTFVESASILGLDGLEDGRAFALADLDGDGRLEVLVKNRTAPQVRVFHNDLQLSGGSIAFALKGITCNRDAIGAVVVLWTASGIQRQMVTAGTGFLSQHSKCLVFGLGEETTAITATIHWPGGASEECKDLPANHKVYLEQGKGVRRTERFKPHTARHSTQSLSGAQDIGAASETWLVEPIAPPDFSLADEQGTMRSLNALAGPALLILGSRGCDPSRKQLSAVCAAWPKFQQANLGVLVLLLDVGDATPDSVVAALPFPVVMSDERTRGVYNIFYRYLFERRRNPELPSAFLLDERHQVVKVYSGPFAADRVLTDHRDAPRDAAARLERALPFHGVYFGSGFHHNYFTYGVAYLQYDHIDEALACFERAVAINASQPGAYYNIGLIYLNKNVLDRAQSNLEKAVQLDPADANAWNNLGVVSGENGDYDRAQRYFERTLALRPSHLLAVQNLVKLYDYRDKPNDALHVLQSAVQAEPASADLHVELAMYLAGKEDFNQAQGEFAAALRLNPRNVAALNGRGAIAMRNGDTAAASQDFQQCIAIAPEFDRAYLNMASLLFDHGRRQQAHDLLAGYLQKYPDNQEVKDVLAQVDSKR